MPFSNIPRNVTLQAIKHGSIIASLVGGSFLLANYNYLAFHTIAEIFSIVVAAALFLLAWHSRGFSGHGSLVALGIAFLFAGIIDLLHTLSYKGMSVLRLNDPANTATQLWIAARWLESLSLLAFPLVAARRLRLSLLLIGYSVVTVCLLWTILFSGVFPDCFLAPTGLTRFKIASEYAICLTLACAFGLLFNRRRSFDRQVWKLLAAAIVAAIISELSFTVYTDVYGLSNLVGHLLKIASFFLVYLALVRSSLTRPYQTLFRELSQSRDDLTRAQAVAHIGSWQFVADRNEFKRSDENYRILGIPKGASRTYETFLEVVHPEDRPDVDAWWKASLAGAPYDIEHRILVEGRVGWVREKASIEYADTGAPLYVIGITQDITDRKRAELALSESEAKYRNLFTNMTEEVHFWQVVRDESGAIKTWKLLDANPPALRSWGRKTLDEIRGKTTDEIFGPGVAAHYKPIVRKVMSEGVPYSFEDCFPNLDKHFRFTTVPLGECFITTGADITAVKKAQASLQKLNETLEQRVAERTQVAESRSRQLQTLAAELVSAEERERRRFADLLHNDLQQVLAAARLQLQWACQSQTFEPLVIVDRYLDESIQKARTLSHELSPAMLYHIGLAASLERLAKQMHEQFGLKVSLEGNWEQPLEGETVNLFLFRAVQELLFNVVKHAGVEFANVELEKNNGNYCITVSDEGKGFDATQLGALSQTHMGIGLLSLKERAGYFGGSLWIDSGPNRGSRFTVVLPSHGRDLPPSEQSGQEAGLHGDSSSVGLEMQKQTVTRVVLVDDHQVMRDGLRKLFSGRSDVLVVGEASNGVEAVEEVRRLRPNLVVMDISMPILDGIEATRLIKSDMPEVKIIGLSMHDDEELGRKMIKAGAECLLKKGDSATGLIRAICETSSICGLTIPPLS
jgi:signal transduction histidine kinase/CheY-like chemotaxis protein